MLGHGAGGAPYEGAAPYRREAVFEPDLLAARDAALQAGLEVVLVEQPWRVAGRRVAEAPARLDEAWLAVVSAMPAGVKTVLGGRSAGARVSCRTADRLAETAEVVGVLCLAFPLRPTGRPEAPSRQSELDLPRVPVLVVQGDRDPFGMPDRGPGRSVVPVPGADHSFAVRNKDGERATVLSEVERAVSAWLGDLSW